jgi:hypothetical protein
MATHPAQYERLGGQKQAGSESKNVVPLATVELMGLDEVPPDPPVLGTTTIALEPPASNALPSPVFVLPSELLLHAVRPRREITESDAMIE